MYLCPLEKLVQHVSRQDQRYVTARAPVSQSNLEFRGVQASQVRRNKAAGAPVTSRKVREAGSEQDNDTQYQRCRGGPFFVDVRQQVNSRHR